MPYGDPAPVHRVKAVFDAGEAGIGSLANALMLGCDCLGEISYLDAVVNDDEGEPVRLPNAICIHEEDTGVGWKHTQYLSGSVEVRRGRRLVISTFSTVGNYDYGFFWYLHTDGTIAYEVKLTGIISTGAFAGRLRAGVRHGGRAGPVRAAPPALLQRAPGHGGGRRRQLGVRGRRGARAGRAGQPGRERLGRPGAAAGNRGRGAAAGRRAGRPDLAGGERVGPRLARPPGRLPAGTRAQHAAAVPAGRARRWRGPSSPPGTCG